MAQVKNVSRKKEKGGPTKGEISRRRCPPASSPTSSAVVGNHVPKQGSNTPAPAPRPMPSEEEVIVIDRHWVYTINFGHNTCLQSCTCYEFTQHNLPCKYFTAVFMHQQMSFSSLNTSSDADGRPCMWRLLPATELIATDAVVQTDSCVVMLCLYYIEKLSTGITHQPNCQRTLCRSWSHWL